MAGLDGIVAEVLGLAARVSVTVGLAVAEPEATVAVEVLLNKFFELIVVALAVIGVEHRRVAPLDGPLVVVADAREDAHAADAILGLGHVIKASVVHDRGSVSVFLHPGFGTQTVDGDGAARPEVVTETEGVAHLVRGDETDEVAHQLLVVLHLLGGLVDASGLDHVPVMNELHHVVVPADVAFEDFARTGVVHVGAIGVLDGRGQVTDDRVAGVLHAHGGVILRPFQGVNSVLEPGFFESPLPHVDGLYEIRD